MVNGSVFLISLSDFSSLVYRNARPIMYLLQTASRLQFKLVLTVDERCVPFLVMLALFGVKSTKTANFQALTYQKDRTTFEVVFRSQKEHLQNLVLCSWLAYQTLSKRFDFWCFIPPTISALATINIKKTSEVNLLKLYSLTTEIPFKEL